MEPTFHGLHPLKRFKLQQQEETPNSSPLLPAKKRKESRDSPPSHLPFNPSTTTTTNLPAKKRVWALEPLFNSPEKPSFSFDLNLEYQQSPEKQPPTPTFNIPQKLNFFTSDTNNNAPEEVNLNQIESCKETEDEEEEEDGIRCGVCHGTDGDPTDPIVFCDGCDLMVHATCYGNPLSQGIPEGDWFCASCLMKEKVSSCSCCLCPVKGGVMKSTTDGKWAHILCALLVPEVFFRNPEGREEIDCSQVPEKRWKEICYICKSSDGCAIECSELKCSLAFHVSCGLNEELCIEYKERRKGKGGDIIAGFCKTHSEIWEKQQHTGKFKIVARAEHEK